MCAGDSTAWYGVCSGVGEENVVVEICRPSCVASFHLKRLQMFFDICQRDESGAQEEAEVLPHLPGVQPPPLAKPRRRAVKKPQIANAAHGRRPSQPGRRDGLRVSRGLKPSEREVGRASESSPTEESADSASSEDSSASSPPCADSSDGISESSVSEGEVAGGRRGFQREKSKTRRLWRPSDAEVQTAARLNDPLAREALLPDSREFPRLGEASSCVEALRRFVDEAKARLLAVSRVSHAESFFEFSFSPTVAGAPEGVSLNEGRIRNALSSLRELRREDTASGILLHKYQEEGVVRIATAFEAKLNCIVADEMGECEAALARRELEF